MMDEQLIKYARISADWLAGMETHVKHGSPDWIVNRSAVAATELNICATTLEALQAENADMKAQLAEASKMIEPLAKHAAHYDPDEGDGNHVTWDVYLTVSDLRAARAWMEKNDG